MLHPSQPPLPNCCQPRYPRQNKKPHASPTTIQTTISCHVIGEYQVCFAAIRLRAEASYAGWLRV